MTITAKYPGKCAVCGERFAAGEQIAWRKGEPSSHAACAAKLPTASEAEYQPPAGSDPAHAESAPGYLPPRAGGPRRCTF